MALSKITSAIQTSNGFAYNSEILETIEQDGEFWLTSQSLARALGCREKTAVTRIYARFADEFPSEMSQTVKLTVSGNLVRKVRVFSLRGAYLIAMLARTKRAKAFRKWILDLIEKEEAKRRGGGDHIVNMARRSISKSHDALGIINRIWAQKGVATSDDLRAIEKCLHATHASGHEISVSIRN